MHINKGKYTLKEDRKTKNVISALKIINKEKQLKTVETCSKSETNNLPIDKAVRNKMDHNSYAEIVRGNKNKHVWNSNKNTEGTPQPIKGARQEKTNNTNQKLKL